MIQNGLINLRSLFALLKHKQSFQNWLERRLKKLNMAKDTKYVTIEVAIKILALERRAPHKLRAQDLITSLQRILTKAS